MTVLHKTLLIVDDDGVTLATYNNALVFRPAYRKGCGGTDDQNRDI
jgi:hypothetical protein